MTRPHDQAAEPLGHPAAEHDELHLLLGAFVLGGLDPQDHQAFTRHLRTCPTCQREAAQLSGLSALLDLVDPRTPVVADGADPAEPEAGRAGVEAPVALLARLRTARRRRRRRLVAVAAALVVVAGLVGAAVAPVTQRLTAPPTRGVVASSPAGEAQVQVDLVTRAWGTELDVRGTGLPTGQVLYLAVTDRSGYSYDVASWTGTASGRTTLTAACWMRSADIARVQVHTREGTTVATGSA